MLLKPKIFFSNQNQMKEMFPNKINLNKMVAGNGYQYWNIHVSIGFLMNQMFSLWVFLQIVCSFQPFF